LSPCANSLDGVASRDFALEFLSACAICAVHLSRFAEELILWCTPHFRFVTLSDAYTTGSSIMPQKRNPDAAELVRGKTGRVCGALQSLLITCKGLPLAYNKDLQEDKEPVFDATDTLLACLSITAGMVRDMRAIPESMAHAASLGFSTATDLADWLVRVPGIPFRDAHHVTGRLVGLAEQQGLALADLPLSVMQEVEPRITADVYSVLSVQASLQSRTSFGGTAPVRVREAVAAAKARSL
jgi:argininosuccinate lyase